MAALFPLERLGFYFVRLDIGGRPPRPGGCFMVIDPVKVFG
jgi:hypothetical protein